jgi:hypothetical protein
VKRFRGYELAIGFLFATAFWAVLFAIYPRYSSVYSQPQNSAGAKVDQSAATRAVEEKVATYTLWLAICTAVLASSTIGLWLVTWLGGSRQSREMKASIAVTQQSAIAAQNSAAAAVEANRLNRDAFIMAQRPWVAARVQPGPITYDVNGFNVGAIFFLTNNGQSPAVHVNVYSEIIAPAIGIDGAFNIRERLHQAIAARKGAPPSPWGSTIHQGQSIVQSYKIVSITRGQLARITQKVDFVSPSLLVVIEYRFVFDNALHFTAFILDIRRKDVPRPVSIAKNRAPSAIFPDEGDIPADDVVFITSPIGEEYAD